MEVDEELTDKPNNKHKIINENESESPVKKQKRFSAKEFRKQLAVGDKITSVVNFLKTVREDKKHDYIFDYLEAGGNCLELLQLLEQESTLNPCIIFELVTYVLLKIIAKYPQHQNSAVEACRYMINTYVTLINKMINLSSTTVERKTALKLLTAVVTLSLNLAKDILINVNFNQTNLELLTKHTGQKDSVRDTFIHFLTAFLVDGHYPSLSILLEKRGLLTSIVRDLQYDNCETVCLVVSAMKCHILENPNVSKTAKMKTFSTPVVRDIVNLYNWKGPASFKTHKKESKLKVEVDELEKSKVSECVHEFLLILCTSHKHGVIFRDFSMGLGKKHQNSLMFTVLESLDRPWEHSYAGQLVTKICKACPDLAKTMWANLKPYLELRPTKKWLNALNFAKVLLHELEPSCIEFCVKEISVNQLSQIISFLILPLPILKTIIPDDFKFEHHIIKQHVVNLLAEFSKSTSIYLQHAKSWLNTDDHLKLKKYLSNYISRNFPNCLTILNDWQLTEELDELQNFSNSEYINIILDLFSTYKTLAPQLLDSLNSLEINIQDFLSTLNTLDSDVEKLQIKVLNLFIDLDHSQFAPKSELFAFAFNIAMPFYYQSVDSNALNVLNKLFKLTNIFDGCDYEINFWINGILDLKKYDPTLTGVLIDVIRTTSDNLLTYIDSLNNFKGEEDNDDNFQDIIESLTHDNVESLEKECIKHKHLSPFLVGFLEHLNDIELTKNLKVYLQFTLTNLFHSQTIFTTFQNIVSNYKFIPAFVQQYVQLSKAIVVYEKNKGRVDILANYINNFLSNDIETTLKEENLNYYPDLILNLIQLSIFYVDKLALANQLTDQHLNNFAKLLRHVPFNDKYISVILGNPNVYRQFSLTHLNKNLLGKFLINTVKLLNEIGADINVYLGAYRKKLARAIMKIVKKPQKYEIENFAEILQMFKLEFNQCSNVLTRVLSSGDFNNSPIIFDVVTYSMHRIVQIYDIDGVLFEIDSNVVHNLSLYLVYLIKEQIDIGRLSACVHLYLSKFPCNVMHINDELFQSLINITDYNKDNVALCKFLLDRNAKYIAYIEENIDIVCEKKFIILPLLKPIIHNVNVEFLATLYTKFESTLNKTLQKPQKAGQHFLNNYTALYDLIKVMPLESCSKFLDKVQKFEVSEVFLAVILQGMSEKLLSAQPSEKQVNNIILTFIHLLITIFKRKTKTDDDTTKLDLITERFEKIIDVITNLKDEFDFKNVAQNETFKLFCKFCLKFGVSGNLRLLSILSKLILLLRSKLEQEEVKILFELLISHSEFLNVVLSDHSDCKQEILSLFLVLCTNWNDLMERNHIPVLLSAYRATVNKCDRIILNLLQRYEKKADQTQFYDFKPFLWDKTAATHYSVRSTIENKLSRQPKMGDVLDILQDQFVRNTIKFYPIYDALLRTSDDENLDAITTHKDILESKTCYDLSFLLPLFSQLLAPENQVYTYKFSRSGALSITIVALSSNDEEVRKAACHVLSRFHFHMEARQSGKDNLLWIRFIEAVCKGTALLDGFKLNNFAAIYLARMALILTQPTHVMYVPMSQYLAAKPSLDFSTVPELYTFLHSSDVNYKEHRHFVLELLRDGLRTDKDFTDFLRSMAFKLFSGLYSSTLSDTETKLLILDVLESCCKIPLGCKVLCENYSLLPQLYIMLKKVLNLTGRDKNDIELFVNKFVIIMSHISKNITEKFSNRLVYNMLMSIISSDTFSNSQKYSSTMYDSLVLLFNQYPELFIESHFELLLNKSKDKLCAYIVKYGCSFISETTVSDSNLRLLFYKKYNNVTS